MVRLNGPLIKKLKFYTYNFVYRYKFNIFAQIFNAGSKFTVICFTNTITTKWAKPLHLSINHILSYVKPCTKSNIPRPFRLGIFAPFDNVSIYVSPVYCPYL